MTALPGGTFTIPDGPARLDAIVGGDSGPLWMAAVIEDTATCHFTSVVPRR